MHMHNLKDKPPEFAEHGVLTCVVFKVPEMLRTWQVKVLYGKIFW